MAYSELEPDEPALLVDEGVDFSPLLQFESIFNTLMIGLTASTPNVFLFRSQAAGISDWSVGDQQFGIV